MKSLLAKWLAVLAGILVVFAIYVGVERPWMLRWGATDAETRLALPGDELVAGRGPRSTRAVTVAAPASRVWPWIAQLGQDRGGFYSFDVLENAVGCEMPRATRILPDRQTWNPGDRLWMYPPDKAEGMGSAPLVRYQPGRLLVFATRQIGTGFDEPENGIWGFLLEPRGTESSRLIVRSAGAGGMAPWMAATHYGLFEPAHFAMERRMMVNLKRLAEGRPVSRVGEIVEVALWTLTIALLLAALVELVRRQRWVRPLLVVMAAAIVFQVLTLQQPPWIVGALLVAGLVTAMTWRRRAVA